MFWEQKSLAGLEKAPEVRIAEVIRVSYSSQYMEIRYLDDASNQVVAAEAHYSPSHSGACITSALVFCPGQHVCVVVAGAPYVVYPLYSPAEKLFYEMDMQFELTKLRGALVVRSYASETGEDAYVLYYVAEDGGVNKFYKFYAHDYGRVFFESDSSYDTTRNLEILSRPIGANGYSPHQVPFLSYDSAFPLSVWAGQGTMKLQNWFLKPPIQPTANAWSLPRSTSVDAFSIGRGVLFDTDDPREALYVRGAMIYDPNSDMESPITDGTGDVYITVGPARRIVYYAYGTNAKTARMRRLQDLFNDVLHIARPYFPGSILYGKVHRFNAIPPLLFAEPSGTHITFGFIECKKNGSLDYNKYYKTKGSIGVTWRNRASESPRILDGVYSGEYTQEEFLPTYTLEIRDYGGEPNIREIRDDRRVRPGYPQGGPAHLVILDDGVNKMTKRPDFLHVQHGDNTTTSSYIDSRIHWDFYINDTFMFTMKSRYIGSTTSYSQTGELWYIHHLDLINKLIFAHVHYYEKTESGEGNWCTVKGVVVDADGQHVIWEVENTNLDSASSYNIRPWMKDPDFPPVDKAKAGAPIYYDCLYFRFPYNNVSKASTSYGWSSIGFYYPSVDTEDAYSMMMMCGEMTNSPYPDVTSPWCGFQVGRNGGWSGWVYDVLQMSYNHYNPYSGYEDPYYFPYAAYYAKVTSAIIKPRAGAPVQKGSDFAATATDPVLIDMTTPVYVRPPEPPA